MRISQPLNAIAKHCLRFTLLLLPMLALSGCFSIF